jgi:hypothetical protein
MASKRKRPHHHSDLKRSDRYKNQPRCTLRVSFGFFPTPFFVTPRPPPFFPPPPPAPPPGWLNNEAFSFFVSAADDIIKRNLYLGRLTKLSNANLGEKMLMSVTFVAG